MSLFSGKPGGREVDQDARAQEAAASGQKGDLRHNAGTPDAPRSGRTDVTTSAEGETMANIGKSISIKGDLTGNEDMVIEGKVDGKVELPNNQVTIGANGTVRAEVNAKSVVVVGRVSGNVNGAERVEIQATGIVEGDVSAPRLVVAEGAVLNGAINMAKRQSAGVPAAPAAQADEVRKVG